MKKQNSKFQIPNSASGQSLIETIVAIFILTSALSAGLGLTIYAFSASSTSQNELIASNLAREGVEVVRMMRDSNWLASDTKATTWDLTTCADIGGKLCYPKTYQSVTGYNSYNLVAGNQRAVFDSSAQTWTLDSSTLNFDLFLQGDGTYNSTNNGTLATFARMVNITFNSASPYTNQNSNQEMIVKSVVAWRGKNCTGFTSTQDLAALVTPCKVTVEEHMTNWKDYK